MDHLQIKARPGSLDPRDPREVVIHLEGYTITALIDAIANSQWPDNQLERETLCAFQAQLMEANEQAAALE